MKEHIWNENEMNLKVLHQLSKLKEKPSHACLTDYEINKLKFERLIFEK